MAFLSYESQSLEIDSYFPCSTKLAEAAAEVKKRKQSLYMEERRDDERNRQKSESQEERSNDLASRPSFRLRSGTDISHALISARYKFRRSNSCQAESNSCQPENDSRQTLKNPETFRKIEIPSIAEIKVIDDARIESISDDLENVQNYINLTATPGTLSNATSEAELFDDCVSRKTSANIDVRPDVNDQSELVLLTNMTMPLCEEPKEVFQDCLSRKASSLDFGTYTETFDLELDSLELDLDSLEPVTPEVERLAAEESEEVLKPVAYAPERMGPGQLYSFF